MGKRVAKIEQVNKSTGDVELEKMKHALTKKHVCYVLITCSKPTEGGHMNVELDYEGDMDLASMLVENANQIFHDKRAHRESL